eukprot:TRINITY_DN1860_c0_g1_i1.p1 TRINITY_DN1860_c0_g1~~TRINITY_DN1860_c0_g1_i1.p1  ORF type:complete len:279 (-),score=48.33 TRINITY_DN1860_c0_g1_i1:356-1192(-)
MDKRVEYVKLDLNDLKQVRRAAGAIRNGKFSSEDPEASESNSCTLTSPVAKIDALVLNAGCYNFKYSKTVDGNEKSMGVCHFGHFLFTKLLFDLCCGCSASAHHEADPCFIVSVSSVGHSWTKKGIDFNDLDWTTRKYDPLEAYCQAKLANIYFANELSRRVEEAKTQNKSTIARKMIIVSNSPGFGRSQLTRDVGCQCCVELLKACMAEDVKKLSLNSFRACTDTTLPSGSYLTPKRMDFWGPPIVGKCSKLAQNVDIAKQLWARTEEIVGEKFDVC